MTIAIEICQDNFIYCKTWTQNLDVKTSKKPKERVKNQCKNTILISFATPYKKVKAKKNTIRKCKNKAILYSSVVDMNFIDYFIPS